MYRLAPHVMTYRGRNSQDFVDWPGNINKNFTIKHFTVLFASCPEVDIAFDAFWGLRSESRTVDRSRFPLKTAKFWRI